MEKPPCNVRIYMLQCIKKLHSSLIATFTNYILRSTENYLNDYKKDYAKRVFSIYLLLHVHVYVISKANTAKCYQCYRWPISSAVHTGRHKGISLQQSIPDYKTHPYIYYRIGKLTCMYQLRQFYDRRVKKLISWLQLS